jgi:hypothetical protein
LKRKAERVIKTFKLWQRLTLFAWKLDWIQRKLDVYRAWYNGFRPMFILGGRTPDEVYKGKEITRAEPCGNYDPAIEISSVKRLHHDGDPHLPVLEIHGSKVANRSA